MSIEELGKAGKEHVRWKKEIRELWKEVGPASIEDKVRGVWNGYTWGERDLGWTKEGSREGEKEGGPNLAINVAMIQSKVGMR